MKKIEVILKVTNACNLKCRYCYNKDADHSEATLSLDRFEKLLNVLEKLPRLKEISESARFIPSSAP